MRPVPQAEAAPGCARHSSQPAPARRSRDVSGRDARAPAAERGVYAAEARNGVRASDLPVAALPCGHLCGVNAALQASARSAAVSGRSGLAIRKAVGINIPALPVRSLLLRARRPRSGGGARRLRRRSAKRGESIGLACRCLAMRTSLRRERRAPGQCPKRGRLRSQRVGHSKSGGNKYPGITGALAAAAREDARAPGQ